MGGEGERENQRITLQNPCLNAGIKKMNVNELKNIPEFRILLCANARILGSKFTVWPSEVYTSASGSERLASVSLELKE